MSDQAGRGARRTTDSAWPAAVLWDMDGTLIDSERIWDVSLADLAVHLGGRLSAPARAAMVGTDSAVSVRLLFRDLGLPQDQAAMTEAATWLMARTAELFTTALYWRPGAPEALAAMAEAGVPSALVTNTERALTELALNTIGRQHFAATVCGDEVPNGKPAPDVYLRAARLLGVAPRSCVAVEDSPTGTAAAEAAGCTVLVVPCVLPVPPGPRRVLRDSLVGLTPAELATLVDGGRALDR